MLRTALCAVHFLGRQNSVVHVCLAQLLEAAVDADRLAAERGALASSAAGAAERVAAAEGELAAVRRRLSQAEAFFGWSPQQ